MGERRYLSGHVNLNLNFRLCPPQPVPGRPSGKSRFSEDKVFPSREGEIRVERGKQRKRENCGGEA